MTILPIFAFVESMIIFTDLSYKTSVTDASLSAALNPNWASKDYLPLWYGATSLLTLPSLSGARSVPAVARFLEALTTCCVVMPHFVYSQSAFSALAPQHTSASATPRSCIFIFTHPLETRWCGRDNLVSSSVLRRLRCHPYY